MSSCTCTHAVSYCHHPTLPPYTCIVILSPPITTTTTTTTPPSTRAFSYFHTHPHTCIVILLHTPVHVHCHTVTHSYTCIVILSDTRTRVSSCCHTPVHVECYIVTHTRTRGVPYCDAHTLHVIRPTTAESNPRVSFLTRHTCPDTHVQTSMDR